MVSISLLGYPSYQGFTKPELPLEVLTILFKKMEVCTLFYFENPSFERQALALRLIEPDMLRSLYFLMKDRPFYSDETHLVGQCLWEILQELMDVLDQHVPFFNEEDHTLFEIKKIRLSVMIALFRDFSPSTKRGEEWGQFGSDLLALLRALREYSFRGTIEEEQIFFSPLLAKLDGISSLTDERIRLWLNPQETEIIKEEFQGSPAL